MNADERRFKISYVSAFICVHLRPNLVFQKPVRGIRK